MDVDWNAELVDQLEWHWKHQLRPRLDGLTDDEYFWQPVEGCWTLSRRGESRAPISLGGGEFTMDYAKPPHEREPVTTIAWRLAHLISLFGPSDAPQPRCP
jgi:DinB superfamily